MLTGESKPSKAVGYPVPSLLRGRCNDYPIRSTDAVKVRTGSARHPFSGEDIVCTHGNMRVYDPDLFLDLMKPKEGGINLHSDQRLFMRCGMRFFSLYGCFPRG